MRLQSHERRELARLLLTTDYSNRKIGEIQQISPSTVGAYRTRIERAGFTLDDLDTMDDLQINGRLLHPDATRDSSKVMPDWRTVHGRLQKEKYLTLLLLWEEYRAEHKGNAYSYAQYTHYYRQYLGKVDVSMRLRHYPGEAVFVDYAGTRIPWQKGKEQAMAEVFVAVLGHSNYTFVWASESQNTEDWIEAHCQALRFFGGVPQTIVPDNLKAAVIRPGADPTLNRPYQEFAQHYESVVLPGRVRKPQDKAKAEQGVLFVTRWITTKLRDENFSSIQEINAAIAPLLEALNDRPLRNYPGTRRTRFEQGDKPALKPLPQTPFQYGVWEPAQKVAKDYHVKVQGHWYSVPFHLVSDHVEARVTFNTVEFFHNSVRVASHVRCRDIGGYTSDVAHMPPNHAAYAKHGMDNFLEWAKPFGTATEAVVRAQFETRHEGSSVAINACRKLQRLARPHVPAEFEAACDRARDIESMTVKSVQSILRTGLYRLNSDTPPQAMPQHSNVRGGAYFAQGGE